MKNIESLERSLEKHRNIFQEHRTWCRRCKSDRPCQLGKDHASFIARLEEQIRIASEEEE